MFLEYYNLIEQPFGVAPDPRFLFLNHTYREALASLWYAIQERRGFVMLVAQPGMGKTTLLFQVLQRLRNSAARTVFLFQTCCDSLDLIRYLLQDLGIVPASDLAAMHQQLNDALVCEARAGRQFVFVIDEAQNLSPSVLETVRLLSDFETSQGKLLQIILAGQPQLLSTLMRAEMVQLRQRISVTASLDPLGLDEVKQYIGHRLAVAGYRGASLFTPGAVRFIARESQGIPRNINNLCFGALSVGMALQRKEIDRRIIDEVAADQDLNLIKGRVTVPRFETSSRHCKVGLQPIALLSTRQSQSLLSRGWRNRLVRRAAFVASVLAIIAVGLVYGMVPDVGPRLLRVYRLVAVPTVPSLKAAQVASGRTSAPITQATAGLTPEAQDGMVIVARGDTLRQISLQHLGHYSPSVAREIQALNPRLVDPNHIESGQTLRLPFELKTPKPEVPDESPEQRIAAVRGG